MRNLHRRRFLQAAAPFTAASLLCYRSSSQSAAPMHSKLPRWRGFNLLEKFTARRNGNPPFRKADFEMMQEWGFDFARLPMSYHCWSQPDPEHRLNMDEAQLKHVDEAVELGRKHNIHINLNLHRAPGYCVNPPKEPLDLWKDSAALDACAHHWAAFAKRYKGLPIRELASTS
jgi:endoglucanase